MNSFRGYAVKTRRVHVGDREYELLGPRDFDALLEEARVQQRFDQDEYLPYWAEFWPTCLVLADAVAAWGPAPHDPPHVLEIGCGLGLVSLVAAGLGYRVTASDYDEDALAFVAENAKRNGLPCPELRYLDWREHYADLRPQRLVGAEVLYETRSLRPVAEFISGHLAAGGFALLSDANRSTADAFETIARHCGLRVETTPAQRPGREPGPIIRGRLFRLEPSRR
jgi:SAM-dependent methyltransferase